MSEQYIDPASKEPFWKEEGRRIELAAEDPDLQDAFHTLAVEVTKPAGLGNSQATKHAREMVDLAIEAVILRFGLRPYNAEEIETAAGLYYQKNNLRSTGFGQLEE